MHILLRNCSDRHEDELVLGNVLQLSKVKICIFCARSAGWSSKKSRNTLSTSCSAHWFQ